MKALTWQAEEEKQRAIKLESHSRRNNLNFFNIPEQEDETATKSESILRNFMEVRLRLTTSHSNVFIESENQAPLKGNQDH